MNVPKSAFFVSLLLVAVAPSVLAADELVGEWTGSNGITIAFREDGAFALGDMKGKWHRSGATLTLTDAEGDADSYQVAVNGDRLTLSGTNLPSALVFERKGKRPAPAAAPGGFRRALEKALAGAETKPVEGKPDAAALSRPPQETPKDVKKLVPKFKSATKELKDPEGKYTFKVPEKWTFTVGQDANARYSIVNPGYAATDVAKHQIVYWLVPILPSDASKGFKDRVEEGARKLDQAYPTFKRGATEVLEAPSGLIGRVHYSGTMSTAYVQNAAVVSQVAVRQIKHYYLAVTIVSLKEAAGELDDDALAVLDAAEIVVKDRDREAEQRLVGGWVIPTKGGHSLETYQFNADGTYRWDFEGSVTATYKDPFDSTKIRAEASAASYDGEVGRYEVRGETIYFVSNKGEQGSFYRIWQEGGKTWLQVGKAKFVR